MKASGDARRRGPLAALVALAGACLAGPDALASEATPARAEIAAQARLNALVDGEPSLAGAALTVKVGDRTVFSGAAGCAQFSRPAGRSCRVAMEPGTKLRVASVSKMASAFTLLSLADRGVIDLDRDVSDYLGWPLRNPAYPQTPITARMLLSHTSSLRDGEVYWAPAPGILRDLVRDETFATEAAPGERFVYANINFGVLASLAETASAERFDRLAEAEVFGPLEIDAGFNWSGVKPGARRRGATLYRPDGDGFVAVADADDALEGAGALFLSDGGDPDAHLAAYVPGANGTLFSPQGGLRASVLDLARLASMLAPGGRFAQAAEAQWTLDAARANGDDEGGLYRAYGLGVQRIEPDQTPFGASLLGHAGEAYGAYTGAWVAPGGDGGKDVVVAYAATGVGETPLRDPGTGFTAVETAMLAIARDVVARDGEARASADEELRPYDPARDAAADIDAAFQQAAADGRRVILAFGGNWCHDSRGLASYFAAAELADLVSRRFILVFVDVGRRDRNLDLAARYGATTLIGTPTVLVLTAEGELLNRDTMHDWRRAHSIPYQETLDYFRALGGEPDAPAGNSR